jgi:hypothetical protein
MSSKPDPDSEYQQWMKQQLKRLLILSLIVIPVGWVLKLLSVVLLGIFGTIIAGYKLRKYKK